MKSNTEREQNQKAKESREAISSLSAGMQAVASAMEGDPALRGLHTTEHLDKPIEGDFGEFRKKWNYTDGCELGTELMDGRVGVVVITVENEGEKEVISVGRTPRKWSPYTGGHSLQTLDPGAGEPGDYLLEAVKGEDDTLQQSFRYLDEDDLRGALVKNNATETILGPNTKRTRQIQISGRVDSVTGLLEK